MLDIYLRNKFGTIWYNLAVFCFLFFLHFAAYFKAHSLLTCRGVILQQLSQLCEYFTSHAVHFVEGSSGFVVSSQPVRLAPGAQLWHVSLLQSGFSGEIVHFALFAAGILCFSGHALSLW